jgi:hypothetical protein
MVRNPVSADNASERTRPDMPKQGDPRSVRHLRPPVPKPDHVEVHVSDEVAESDLVEMLQGLAKLREPIPAGEVEKRPQPTIPADEWKRLPKSKCDECGGYHPLQKTIHLEYLGHAETTKRLLDADPFYSWEPLAYGEDGLPKFDRFGGLWGRLTVCGVSRICYGDATGKNPSSTAVKEIIGDLLRNGAMRYGLALDLWSKLDKHTGRNLADGPTQSRQQRPQAGNGARNIGDAERQVQAAVPPAPNQDALDSLASVCDEHGYDLTTMRTRFWEWAESNSKLNLELTEAPGTDIIEFAQHLIIQATPDPPVDASGGGGTETGVDTGKDEPAAEVDDNEPPF